MRIRSDTAIGLVLLVFCAIMFLEARKIPEPLFGSAGAAFFPTVLLFLLTPLCAVLFLRGLVGDLRAWGAPLAGGPRRTLRAWLADYRNVIVCFVLFFLFVAALEPIGYALSGFVFLFAMQVYLGPRSWPKIAQHAGVSAGVVLVLWTVFRKVLIVLLPEGEIFHWFS
jgi:hypothetical protein